MKATETLALLLVLTASGCVSLEDNQQNYSTTTLLSASTTTLYSVPTTTQTTLAAETTQTTLRRDKITLESFQQSPCPANYLSSRYENEVYVVPKAKAGTSLELMDVVHQLDYVCCANITVAMNTTVEDSYTIVNLYEKNVGGVCRCICGYNITSIIFARAPVDLIRVYGVEYEGEGSELIKEVPTGRRAGEGGFCGGIAGIMCDRGFECRLDGGYPDAGGVCVRTGGKAECTSDSDCAAGGCSGQVCTTKSAAADVITTCEMRSEYECYRLTSCACVSGKCAWKKNANFDSCMNEKAGGVS